MNKKFLILILIIILSVHSSFSQEKIQPTFPDYSFYNFQTSHDRVKQALNKYQEGWKKLFAEKKLNFPNTNIFLRAFKSDGKLEVWAANTMTDTFTLVKTFSICALSGKLGPKRAENDRQVPEGFYFIDEYKYNSNYWLSLLVSYPNYSDLMKGNKETPGGEIFIHGSCVTIGCMPMTDDYIEEIYAITLLARTNGQLNIPIHVFPTYFTRRGLDYLGKNYKDPDLQKFWLNLKKGYDLFESNKKVFPVMYDMQGNYIF